MGGRRETNPVFCYLFVHVVQSMLDAMLREVIKCGAMACILATYGLACCRTVCMQLQIRITLCAVDVRTTYIHCVCATRMYTINDMQRGTALWSTYRGTLSRILELRINQPA